MSANLKRAEVMLCGDQATSRSEGLAAGDEQYLCQFFCRVWTGLKPSCITQRSVQRGCEDTVKIASELANPWHTSKPNEYDGLVGYSTCVSPSDGPFRERRKARGEE